MKNLILLSMMLFPMFLIGQNILESEVNPDGIIFPRIDTNARDALTAVQGQCIYNTDANSIECYDGTNWAGSGGSGGGAGIGFAARVNTDYLLPNFTETTITSYAEDYDPSGSFNNTTGTFMAPVDGFYHFDVKMSFSRDNLDFDNIPVILRLKVNGAVIKAHGQLVDRITLRSNYGQDMSYGTDIELVAGDQVTVTVNAVSGNAAGNVKIAYSNGSGDSSFAGYLID